MASEKGWESSQLRKYDLLLEQIPKLHVNDPGVDELLAQNVRTLLRMPNTTQVHYNLLYLTQIFKYNFSILLKSILV